MPRKTIQVTALVEMANNYLRNSEDEKSKERFAIADYIDTVLHKTDNYGGYAYLTIDDMQNSTRGKSIGIEFTEQHDPVMHDQSRRRYHIKSNKDQYSV